MNDRKKKFVWEIDDFDEEEEPEYFDLETFEIIKPKKRKNNGRKTRT